MRVATTTTTHFARRNDNKIDELGTTIANDELGNAMKWGKRCQPIPMYTTTPQGYGRCGGGKGRAVGGMVET